MDDSDQASVPSGSGGPTGRLAATTGENLLVVGPPMVGKRSFGFDVLGAAARAGRDVLVVVASRPVNSLPFDPNGDGEFGVVDCTPGSAREDGPVVDVGSPGDLTGISMPVSRFLDGADDPVVLFDSVSSILHYAEEEPAFRFFSVLTSHVARDGGLGLYTLDESVHGDRTVRTFSNLFDGRVDLHEARDGVEVRVRNVEGVPGEWTR